MKNIFEEEKKFDSRTRFFFENSSQLGVFWPRQGPQANRGNVRKSNQDLILYEGDSNLIKAQPVKVPHFKSLLTRKQAR